MKQEILLRRQEKVIVQAGTSMEPLKLQLGILIDVFEKIGYQLSRQLLEVLMTLGKEELEKFYKEMIKTLNKISGNDKKYDPMYRNFPKEVMEKSEIELYINAYVHYVTDGILFPISVKQEQKALKERSTYKVIDIGSEEDFTRIFTNLMKSKTSLSATDLEDLAWFIRNYPVYTDYLPQEIPFKENVALVGKCMMEKSLLPDIEAFRKYFKTATDVLRLITALSEGDLSLANNTRYRSFKRWERRFLLALLEGCNNIEEDMVRYAQRWIRIGERLHPGEYGVQYPRISGAFNKLRNNEKIWTYYGKLTQAMEKKDDARILDLLIQRPGEFARRLDHVLRSSNNPHNVIESFEKVASEVASPVLLQVRQHFKDRKSGSNERIYFPKGNVAKARRIATPLPPLDEIYCKQVEIICTNALIDIYGKKEAMGKVYLSEDYKDYMAPFSQRSASKALNTVTRGSKFDIPVKGNTLRTFVWWKNAEYAGCVDPSVTTYDRTDIDLSLTAYDCDWNYMEHIAYTNLKSDNLHACHSGDVVDAPEGASEFIDINLEQARLKNVRYLVTSLQCYTGQKYCDLPECFMGWMNRKDPELGEVYEPKLVENKIDLASDTPICIPFIIDLQMEKLIWADMMSNAIIGEPINIEHNQGGILLACQSITSLKKPSLYELIELNIMARGERTFEKSEANIIFDKKDGIKPSQIELFMAEYL